jgi:hypothetical protein
LVYEPTSSLSAAVEEEKVLLGGDAHGFEFQDTVEDGYNVDKPFIHRE